MVTVNSLMTEGFLESLFQVVFAFRSSQVKLVNNMVRMRDRFPTLKDFITGLWISPGPMVVMIDLDLMLRNQMTVDSPYLQ